MPTTLPLRLLQLITGLFLYGFGASLMIRAAIGVAPWDVLSQGIAAQTPLSFGLATNAIGALAAAVVAAAAGRASAPCST